MRYVVYSGLRCYNMATWMILSSLYKFPLETSNEEVILGIVQSVFTDTFCIYRRTIPNFLNEEFHDQI